MNKSTNENDAASHSPVSDGLAGNRSASEFLLPAKFTAKPLFTEKPLSQMGIGTGYSQSEVARFQQLRMQHLLLVTQDGQLQELSECPDEQKAEVLMELRREGVPVGYVWRMRDGWQTPERAGTLMRNGFSMGNGFSEKRRLEKIFEWLLAMRARRTIKVNGAALLMPADLDTPEQITSKVGQTHSGEEQAGEGWETKPPTPKGRLLAYRQLVLLRAQEAEQAFWDDMPDGIGPGLEWRFQPFADRGFSAEECLQYPVTEKARRWFRHLRELHRIEKALQTCSAQGVSAQTCSAQGVFAQGTSAQGTSDQVWSRALKAVLREAAAFASADLAWKQHVRLWTRGDAQAAVDSIDFLAAWAAERVGERYLLPCLEKSHGMVPATASHSERVSERVSETARNNPRPNHNERLNLRTDLVLEIWGSILALKPCKLSVTDFCRLPSAAAALVREAHCSGEAHGTSEAHCGGDVPRGGYMPARYLRLPSRSQANAWPPQSNDPHEVLESRQQAERLWTMLQALPLQQRRAIELDADGWSRKEIAATLCCKEESVKTHLRRARQRLRSALATVPEFEK